MPGHRLSSVGVIGVAVLLTAIGAPARDLEPPRGTAATPRVQIAGAEAWSAVQTAVLGAASRLEDPECAEVLTDFADASGRTLLENLHARTPSVGEYVSGWVSFIDDRHAPQCLSQATAAFTGVGHRVVRICPLQFTRLARRRPAGDILVIHELLHTLGLGEDPPSSAEITRHVERRCAAN